MMRRTGGAAAAAAAAAAQLRRRVATSESRGCQRSLSPVYGGQGQSHGGSCGWKRRLFTSLPAAAEGQQRAPTVVSNPSDDLLLSVNMGWGIAGDTQAALIDSLAKNGVVTSARLAEAMRSVDRKDFVLPEHRKDAYENKPLSIGFKATISTPQHHAHILNLLADRLTPGARALDIGCGSGYLVAVMAEMIDSADSNHSCSGVVGVDIIPELCQLSRENITRHRERWINSGFVSIQHASGRFADLQSKSSSQQFDAIHVGASCESEERVLEWLLPHLAPGGRIVAPIGVSSGEQQLVQKAVVMNVLCQPLVDVDTSNENRMTIEEKKMRVKQQLATWEEEFISKNGRKPKRDDMFGDPTAKQLFAEFSRLSKWSNTA